MLHAGKQAIQSLIFAGHASPSGGDSVISKNPNGSVNVKLSEGSLGGFSLPTVNGTLPAQKDVRLIFGRKLLMDQVLLPIPSLCLVCQFSCLTKLSHG